MNHDHHIFNDDQIAAAHQTLSQDNLAIRTLIIESETQCFDISLDQSVTMLVINMLSLTVLPILVFPEVQAGANKATVYGLYDSLFGVRPGALSYNPYVRPVNNTDTKLPIKLSFSLLAIVTVDEKSQTMTTSADVGMEWTDSFLSWDINIYSNLSSITVPQSKLWLPDIIVGNSVDSRNKLGYGDLPVRLSNDGKLLWSPTLVSQTSCDITVTYYPFDSQVCKIEFQTAVSTNMELEVWIMTDTPVSLASYSEDGTWELESVGSAQAEQVGGHTFVTFYFLLTRRTTFYVVNLLLPVMFLSVTSSLVFLLPADAGEKMGTSITVLLAFAVYLSIVSDYLPSTSLSTSILAVYLTLLLGYTSVGVVMSVFVLRLHHTSDAVAVRKIWQSFTDVMQVLGCRRHPRSPPQDENAAKSVHKSSNAIAPELDSQMSTEKLDHDVAFTSPEPVTFTSPGPVTFTSPGRAADDLTWQEVAAAVDWLSFLCVSSAVCVTTVVVLLQLTVGSVTNKPEVPSTAKLFDIYDI